jgi:hypothetical protein
VEPCFNDREIVVKVRRSAQMLDVLKQLIHHAALTLSQDCQIGDTIIDIPDLPPLAKDFEHAIAED